MAGIDRDSIFFIMGSLSIAIINFNNLSRLFDILRAVLSVDKTTVFIAGLLLFAIATIYFLFTYSLQGWFNERR